MNENVQALRLSGKHGLVSKVGPRCVNALRSQKPRQEVDSTRERVRSYNVTHSEGDDTAPRTVKTTVTRALGSSETPTVQLNETYRLGA
jgi:hypothetical protein